MQNDLCYNERKKTGRKFDRMSLQEKNHGCFFATAFLFTTTTVRNILFLS